MWHFQKVPKILHLYWGCNKPLSYLKYLTAWSFHKHNPDWDIQVHCPDTVCNKQTWGTGEQANYNYNGPDYLNELSKIPNVQVYTENLDSKEISSNISEVHKSDLYRLWLLAKCGGVWSDFDIFYVKSIEEMSINNTKNWDLDFAVSYNTEFNYNAIGFLIGAPVGKFSFFWKLFKEAQVTNLSGYQSIGRHLFDKYYPAQKDKIAGKLENIPSKTVYPVTNENLNKMYKNKELVSDKDTIGYHWFAGSAVTSQYENRITEENLSDFTDKALFALMEKELEDGN